VTPRDQGAAIGTGKLDYDDYASMPDDGKRYEILDGELAVTASPVVRHQRVSRNLEFLLHAYVSAHGLGEVFDAPLTVILDAHTIVEPDLVFVSSARAAIVKERFIDGAPDLLVEILSPSTAARDRGAKAKLYAQLGVDEYWIVDADARTLDVFERSETAYRASGALREDDRFSPRLLPGLTIALSSVWS
jgi:Uma2 family endonuclease